MSALVDLSQRLSAGMSVPPGLPEPTFETIRRVGEHRSNVTQYSFSSHMGTHMDAPFHYFAERAHLDEIDVGRFKGRGLVVPIRQPGLGKITPDDFADYREQLRGMPFVLISTGWARHFGTAEYFNHPYLGEDAAQELVALDVGCVILDTLTPDAAMPVRPPDHTGPIHKILLGSDVLIVENAGSMSQLEGRQVEIFAFPAAIAQSDGAPVRLVAEVEPEEVP